MKEQTEEFNRTHRIKGQFLRIRACGEGTGFPDHEQDPNKQPRIVCTFDVYGELHQQLVDMFLRKLESENLHEFCKYYDYLLHFGKLVKPEQLQKYEQ